MTDLNITELRKLAEQALDHIDDICLGKAQWTMTVPLRESDSDMLFSAVASGLCEALDRLERAEATIERVRVLHAKHENTLHTTPRWVCSHRHCIDDMGDQNAYPCPTIDALDTGKEKNE